MQSTNAPSFKNRSEYIKYRNERIISINFGDPDTKKAIQRMAKADGRTVNSWMRMYVVPHVQEVLEQQEIMLKARLEQRAKRAKEALEAAKSGKR